MMDCEVDGSWDKEVMRRKVSDGYQRPCSMCTHHKALNEVQKNIILIAAIRLLSGDLKQPALIC